MTTKIVIGVESDELTCKESTHLDNLSFELATDEAVVTAFKRDSVKNGPNTKKRNGPGGA